MNQTVSPTLLDDFIYRLMPDDFWLPAARHSPETASEKTWILLDIAADWFEENGDELLSLCLRWCRKNRKRPVMPGSKFYWYSAPNNTHSSSVDVGDFPKKQQVQPTPTAAYRALAEHVAANNPELYQKWKKN